MSRTALIIGATGQDGAYLAQHLLSLGYRVHGSSRDAETSGRGNLRRLGIDRQVTLHSVAPNDFRSVMQTVAATQPDEIYNLAGQSSVGLSFQQPAETLESIAVATLNMLEVVRLVARGARLYNACSSECFGDLGGKAADEETGFRPLSPYATAKATAHWLVENYRRAYDLYACSGILFNHESPLRPERFVTRKIIAAAVRIAAGSGEKLQLGNLAVWRDWGWAPDYVDAMHRMLQQPTPGDFVIATGEAHSLEEFTATAFAQVGLHWRDHVTVDPALYRRAEVMHNVGNPAKAAETLGWRATFRMREVVQAMVDAERAGRGAD
jgi:GDPmannose 4,6-dehydratase